MKNLNLKPGQGHPIGRALGSLAFIAILLTGCGKSADEYIRQAQTELDAGKIPAAIIELKNALQKEPKNLTARAMLGQAYLDISDWGNAETDLLRAQTDGASPTLVAKPLAQAELQLGKFDKALNYSEVPPDASASLKASLYGVRGMAYLAQGKTAEADDAFAAGLKEDPHSVDLLLYLTRVAMARRDLAAARARVNEALGVAPAAPRVLSVNGTVTFAEGKYPDAEAAFAQVRKLQPWNLIARVDLAQAQIAQNKLKEADEELDAALKASPKATRANYLRAVTAYREKDYKTAQTYIQNVLSGADSSPPALLLAGGISYALDEFEQANSLLGKYVALAPNDVEGRQLLAATEMRLGRPADAVKTLSPAANNSDNAQLLAMIGEAALRSGDAVGGEKYLTQALEKQPDNSAVRTELGLTKASLGQTDAAIEEFEKAGKQDPNAIGPDAALFATYLHNKEFDKALSVAESLEAKQPTNPFGFDYAGIALLAKGDRVAANAALSKARELRPTDQLTLRLLAMLALQDGKRDVAIDYYETLAKANPTDDRILVAIAQIQLEDNKPDLAQASLQKAIDLNPDDIVPRVALGRLLVTERKGQEATNVVQPALAKNPRQPDLLEVAGEAQLSLGQTESALNSLRTLVEVAPQSSIAHRELATAYLAARSPDQAVSEAETAFQLAPQDRIVRHALASALLSAKKLDEARQRADEWATAAPQDADYAELQGLVASAQDRRQDAIDAFRRAVAALDNGTTRQRLATAQDQAGLHENAEKTLTAWLDAHPDDLVMHAALAQHYLGNNQTAQASDQYAEILRQAPSDIVAENNLAWTLSLLGRKEEALEHARHAAAAAPNDPNVVDTLGVVLLQNAKATEARDALEKAAKAAPSVALIQFHYAQALKAAGETDRAREVLRALLARPEPFHERDDAQKLLKDLG